MYRCINEACARAMPRPVAFCPYCGTAQTAAARAHAPVRADGEGVRPVVAAAAAAGWSDSPDVTATPGPSSAAAVSTASAGAARAPSAAPAPAASSSTSSAAAPNAAPSATAFGHSARHGATPASPAAPPPPPPERARGIPWTRTPKAPAPPGPGGRTPVRLRWWLLALALLWAVWMVAKPSAKKLERRIDAAIVLAQDCKAKGAQDELIALRAAHATPAQLERLQRAMNEASAACTRKRQRDKAWNDASGAAEIALAGNNPDKARARLQTFVRRWGEDDETRALQARIEAGRHPLAAPEAGASSGDGARAAPRATQSARNLIAEARADLARGDAGAARDKMDLCLTMVDPSDRDCAALKAEAERADSGR